MKLLVPMRHEWPDGDTWFHRVPVWFVRQYERMGWRRDA